MRDVDRLLLGVASEKGRREICEIMLYYGANPNSDCSWFHEKPLILASKQGHWEICKLLLDRGAHIYEALHIASSYGHTKICELLLSYGADITAKAKGHVSKYFFLFFFFFYFFYVSFRFRLQDRYYTPVEIADYDVGRPSSRSFMHKTAITAKTFSRRRELLIIYADLLLEHLH
jgi:ankyrin repeat protein